MKEKQELYNRAYQLEQEILTLSEDLKELKGEYTYEKEYNTDGFPKADVADIMKAAKAKVKQDDLMAKADEYNKLQEIQDMYSK
jgi:hypothetical protein